MTTTNTPWQPDARWSRSARHAFAVYRDLGPQRSLAKAQEALGKNAGYVRQLEKYCAELGWVERAAAFDAHQDTLKRQADEDAIVRMSEQVATEAAAGRRLAVAVIRSALEDIQAAGSDSNAFADMPLKQKIQLLRPLSKALAELYRVERLARGLPESEHAHAHSVTSTESAVLRDLIQAGVEVDALAAKLSRNGQ